tara:strand:+ start:8505 stop:8687 length:183 start_codon:yes stop_codon:yes gene_type:complete
MPKFNVDIVASISKTIEVIADSEEHAEELAHEMFHAGYDGTPEIYEQETHDIEEITDANI